MLEGKNILLGINTMIASKSKVYTKTGERLEGCLVRSESKIFALENFRTCVNVFSSGNNKNTYGNKTKTASSSFQPAFTYSDTNGFFDSFKTVTSKSAGRQRLLLDNVVLKHGLLWIVDDDGEMHNMYEYIFNCNMCSKLSLLYFLYVIRIYFYVISNSIYR